MSAEQSRRDDITVVIPTVGRADALRICLASLAAQTVLPAEVIVVHSGSDAETGAVCNEPHVPLTVRYFAYPHRSAALQRDFAVRRSKHALIMFADDDMEFQPDWIEQLERVVARDPNIGAAMGCIVNQSIALPTVLWRLYRKLVTTKERSVQPGAVVGALVPNGFPADAADVMPAEWLGGCITLLRKEAYVSVNGFAPHYRGSSPGEDVDLGYRISRRWKVVYVPQARCLHHQSPSGRDGIARHQFLSMRSRYAFLRTSVGISRYRAWGHIVLWAAFQTASELAQVRRGRMSTDVVRACWGRLRGAWSCVEWNPASEEFPEWHDTHGNV